MSGQLRGFFLVFVLFGQQECGWIKEATDQHVCEGNPVSFPWTFNSTVDTLKGAAVHKFGTPPIDIFSQEAGKNVSVFVDGYTFLPNAGFGIENVTLPQAGQYNVRVVFENSSFNLEDEKSLVVHPASDCPDAAAFSNPEVIVVVINVKPDHNTTCDAVTSSLPVNIAITTSVPRGTPAVEAYIEDESGGNATCYGAAENDTSCHKEISISSYGNHSIEVLLTYIAYDRQKTIIYCNITQHMPFWNYMIAIIIIAVFVALVIIIFLVCFLCWCCKKYGGKVNNEKTGKGASTDPEGTPMVAYPSPTGNAPQNATPMQVRDDESVDPYKCVCAMCPEDSEEYCCQEIATFGSLTDDQHCITQTPQFRDIIRRQKERPVSNEERRMDAFKAIGSWIWHMENKQAGYPACFTALATREFPTKNAPTHV